VRCVANLSAGPVELPPHDAVLLTSGPLTDGGQLPPDATAWLSV
jgi:alpha-glucosidase